MQSHSKLKTMSSASRMQMSTDTIGFLRNLASVLLIVTMTTLCVVVFHGEHSKHRTLMKQDETNGQHDPGSVSDTSTSSGGTPAPVKQEPDPNDDEKPASINHPVQTLVQALVGRAVRQAEAAKDQDKYMEDLMKSTAAHQPSQYRMHAFFKESIYFQEFLLNYEVYKIKGKNATIEEEHNAVKTNKVREELRFFKDLYSRRMTLPERQVVERDMCLSPEEERMVDMKLSFKNSKYTFMFYDQLTACFRGRFEAFDQLYEIVGKKATELHTNGWIRKEFKPFFVSAFFDIFVRAFTKGFEWPQTTFKHNQDYECFVNLGPAEEGWKLATLKDLQKVETPTFNDFGEEVMVMVNNYRVQIPGRKGFQMAKKLRGGQINLKAWRRSKSANWKAFYQTWAHHIMEHEINQLRTENFEKMVQHKVFSELSEHHKEDIFVVYSKFVETELYACSYCTPSGKFFEDFNKAIWKNTEFRKSILKIPRTSNWTNLKIEECPFKRQNMHTGFTFETESGSTNRLI